MAKKNETFADVIADFAYLITLGNIGPNVANDIKNRIEAEHRREVEKLTRLLEAEADDKLRVIAELNEVRELNRKCCAENEELRECLKEALSQRYCSKWLEVLKGAGDETK